mgnify:FL=1
MENVTIGRIVHYVLSPNDAARVSEHRADYPRRRGNDVRANDVIPAIVVWPHNNEQSTFNGQAFLDGDDVLWLMSVPYNADGKPGTWHWPPRA